MSGDWLDPRPPVRHECALPLSALGRPAGSRWRCECGRVWRYVGEADDDYGPPFSDFVSEASWQDGLRRKAERDARRASTPRWRRWLV